MKMYERFPRASFALLTAFVCLPHVKPTIELFFPPKTFGDGVKQGREEARKELQLQAKNAVEQEMKKVEEDAAKLLWNKEPVSEEDFQSKLLIAMLPRWKITLLGDEYVVRYPLNEHFNRAWMMTAEDSKKMDDAIQKMLKGTKYEIDKEKNRSVQQCMKTDIQDLLEKSCEKVMKT